MKIVFFYQYFCTTKGSWSTRIYEIARRWVQAGHEVTVVTAPYEKSDIKANGLISKQVIDGIEIIVINIHDSNRFSFFKRSINAGAFTFLSLYFALFLKYDILIASSGPLTIGLPMIVAKSLRNKAAIFEVRDLWPAGAISMGKITNHWQKSLSLWLEAKCYKKADVVVTASPAQREDIQKRFPGLQVEVIANGADLYLFGEKMSPALPEWTHGKILFTHLGSLGFIHNVKYWLAVAKEVQKLDLKKEIVFVFIGEGAERNELEKIKRKEEISNVYFLGLKPKHELPQWVQASRATLFATLNDPVQNTCSPNKLFDSFAAGVPVVQTTTGWIKDLIKENNCGVNVPLEDATVAARDIIYLAENPEAALNLGKRARRLAETTFNREQLTEQYLNILKDVVS